jgi:hypothetical protein
MYPYKRQIVEPTDDYTITLDSFEYENGLNIKPVDFSYQNATYSCLLRTDDHINMSGIYLNANNKVAFEWSQDNSAAEPYLWTTILTHTKVLKCTADNARVLE